MPQSTKYLTLLNILDRLRKEAPSRYRRYHVLTTDIDGLNHARARSFIHLFLKVKFGLLDFMDREHFITDNPGDGGVDAYYIDRDMKKVLFIQSKFRTTEQNFRESEITAEELLQMDVSRITEGETHDEAGLEYNGKIRQLQREISELPDIGRYTYKVIILANMRRRLTPNQIRRLTGGFSADIYDFSKTYNELVFPIVSGTYYNEPELCITLNLTNTTTASARVSYTVNTTFKPCDISLVFVPTVEIGRILHKYKNSILKFNPRSFLELARNAVNKDISSTITQISTNEFALFNNGITMLSEGTAFNESVGVRNQAQVIVTNPQIINGGQTAFTLSRLYEDVIKGRKDEAIFLNKEVLLKIITFNPAETDIPESRLNLIEAISKATNSQTQVTDADRRSNDRIQIEIQESIYSRYGYYYERKLGEFVDGLRYAYINKDLIIDREIFLRCAMACDFRVSEARRNSVIQIFREDNFNRTLPNTNRIEEYMYAYKCFTVLTDHERTFSRERHNRYGVANYGQALRYGKFAVVAVCNRISEDKDISNASNVVNQYLDQWIAFEEDALSRPSNSAYFERYQDPVTSEIRQELNYSGYYKGSTIASDLRSYFNLA